jgi:hypothetical protein
MTSRCFGWSVVVGRGGIEPPTFRFSGGRSYRLSYLPGRRSSPRAVPTGFEPAASTLTGWRALQAAPRDLDVIAHVRSCPQRDSNPCYRLERAAS